MKKAWAVAWADVLIVAQNRQSWVYLLLVPALVIYLAGQGAREATRLFAPVIRVDVLDDDRSATSRSLAAALSQANPAFVVCVSSDEPPEDCLLAGAPLTPELAADRLAEETTSATIAIPEGFASALAEGRQARLEFHPGAALIAPDMVMWALRSATTELAGPVMAASISADFLRSLGVATSVEQEAALLAAARESWGPPSPVGVATEVIGQNDKMALGARVLSNGFSLSTPSVTAMFVMISLLGLTQSLAEERFLGILRRIGSMPVRRREWLAGKVMGTSLLGLAQVAALLGFGALLGVGFERALAAVLLVSAAYVLALTALAVALATAARTPHQASAFATVAWLVLVPLGGGWWPLAFVPSWLRTVGHLSPVAWYVEALQAIVGGGARWPDVMVPTAVLMLFAIAFGIVGIARLDLRRAGGEGAAIPLDFGAARSGDSARTT